MSSDKKPGSLRPFPLSESSDSEGGRDCGFTDTGCAIQRVCMDVWRCSIVTNEKISNDLLVANQQGASPPHPFQATDFSE